MNTVDSSTSTGLEMTQKIITVKFDTRLSREQLLNLIKKQPEPLRLALLAEKVSHSALNELVETISEEITGIQYPSEQSTPYYKEYFRKKLKECKDRYFGIND